MFKLSPLPRNLPAALRDAHSDKFSVRLSAVRDLGRLGAGLTEASEPSERQCDERRRVVAALAERLRDDGAAGVRAEAVLALVEAQARGELALLLDALDDVHLRVRQMALVAIGELAKRSDRRALERVRGALRSSEPGLRFQALLALHQLDEDIDEPLLSALEDDDAEIRYVALRIIEERFASNGSTPAATVASVRERLGDESAQVRLAATIFLLRAGLDADPTPVVDAVNTGLGAREAEDQQACIELAGDLRLKSARPGLRRRAFRAWGLLGDSFAWQARVSLAKMGDERAVDSILRGLRSFSYDTRTLAVAAAAAAGLQQATPVLNRLRGDQSRADPDTVARALETLRAEPAAVSAVAPDALERD